MVDEYGVIPLRRFSARIVHAFARMFGGPNLWAWEYGARLQPHLAQTGELFTQ